MEIGNGLARLFAMLLVAVFTLSNATVAEASHCGSYVIANPSGQARTAEAHAGLESESGKHAPHVPTPCEGGHCRSHVPTPFAPPSAPPVRPVEHLWLQLFASVKATGELPSHFFSELARARAGFYRELEQPPDTLVS